MAGTVDFSLLEQRVRNSFQYITKRMIPDFEDDCVQECLMNFHNNGYGQTVDQAVIDFLRKYFSGRSDSKSYEIRKNMNNYSEINPSTQSQNAINEFPIDLTSFLKGRTKLIVEKYSQGFTFKEIGNEIGVTESRAHQIFSDYVDKMLILLTVPKEVRHWAAKNVF